MKDAILKAIREAADMNKDGQLDTKDLIQIAQLLFTLLAKQKDKKDLK